jgi:hypothetical protein
MNPTSWIHSAAEFNSLVTSNKSSEPNFLNVLLIVLNCPLQNETESRNAAHELRTLWYGKHAVGK